MLVLCARKLEYCSMKTWISRLNLALKTQPVIPGLLRECSRHVDRLLASVPSNCVVCDLPAAHSNLCTLCISHLPRLESVCHRCGLAVTLGTLCGPCLLRPPPWHSMICAVSYGKPYDKLMASFKFQGQRDIASALSYLLIDAVSQRRDTSIYSHLNACISPDSADILVPVPLHWTRLWTRGFNQAALLARPISKRFDIPIVHALKRTKRTRAQTLIQATSRRANLSQAFLVSSSVKGLHVILLDDVVTTGATALSATRALLRAGASSVCVWACVRAKSRHPTKSLRAKRHSTKQERQGTK